MFAVLSALAAVANADVIYKAEFYNQQDTKIGQFTFNQGRISIEITTTEGIPEACYANTGYAWHLHGNNNFANVTHGFGADECGKPQAGYHYDPTLACSEFSDATACTCLNRALDYSCENAGNPFTCELGDFNSKHEGGWIGQEPPVGLTIGVQNFEDHYLDVDLSGMSIVFHCGDLQTIFCGKLVQSETQNNNPRLAKPTSDPSSLIADFGFGAITVNDVNIQIESESAVLADILDKIPAACYASGLSYHIHEKWTHTADAAFGADCGAAFTGGHYDPTAACGTASGNPECGTCGLLSTNYACAFLTNPYSCEVGDLSGKYGLFDVNSGYKQTDSDFLPGLHLLAGKSIVLHCGDGSRAVCAKLNPGAARTSMVTYTDGTEVGFTNGPPPPLNCSEVVCAKDLDGAASPELNCIALALMFSLLFFC